MPYAATASRRARDAARDAQPVPLWLDTGDRAVALAALHGAIEADLAVVGGGFTGLWTALLAKEADPGLDVVLLEASRIADGASGRNGGFCAASLTHGLVNGHARFAAEMPQLVALGQQNLDAIVATIEQHRIDCGLIRRGELTVATEQYQLDDLRELEQLSHRYGVRVERLDADQARAVANSPLYLGGVLHPDAVVMLDPARLAWGLRDLCLARGVRIYEHTPVDRIIEEPTLTRVARSEVPLRLLTADGSVVARRVALATNAYPPLLKRIRAYMVPVWDYVIATEPLPHELWNELGWASGIGIGDAANQFHYYRTTQDRRIVFGGYDAVYYRANGFGPQYAQRPETFAMLAEHLVQTFPALDGTRISHAWGGAIDTCSRFAPFWGTARHGRIAYAVGFTGLGVGASRYAGQTLLQRLGIVPEGGASVASFVHGRPAPFPPEPIRSWGINKTRAALDSADRDQGRRGTWLRTLDRMGLGFDS